MLSGPRWAFSLHGRADKNEVPTAEEGLAADLAKEDVDLEVALVDGEAGAISEGACLPFFRRRAARTSGVEDHQLVCHPPDLAQEGDAFALLHVAIEMTSEDSPDGLRSQRKACGVGAQYRDAGDALSKATKGGLALIQRVPAAREQRGEHPGAGTHVDIASRRELGEGVPD